MTDKSWPILLADSVGREKSFVCHRKIGQFFSADKSWLTKNIFKRLKTRWYISGNCALWLVGAFIWNIQAAERRGDDQIDWSVWS